MYPVSLFGVMAETDTGSASDSTATGEDEDDIARINMRVPQEKYEWLQEELDSFTSDTARVQFLIQFYSDHKAIHSERVK